MYLSISVPKSHLSLSIYFREPVRLFLSPQPLAALQGSTEAKYETHTFMARRFSNVGLHHCYTPTTMTGIFRKLFSSLLGTRFSQLHSDARSKRTKKQN